MWVNWAELNLKKEDRYFALKSSDYKNVFINFELNMS